MAVERLLTMSDQVTLTGISKSGKKLIEDHGTIWKIDNLGTPECLQPGRLGTDVWGYLGKSIDTGELQWFKEEDDENFEYEYYNSFRVENGKERSQQYT